jgi:hypothetical protein
MREELRSLKQLGRVEKELDINKELKLIVHTLSVLEQQVVMERLPEGGNDISRFVTLQKETLVEAIDKINNLDVTKEDVREFLESLQYNILAEIFTKYNMLAEDQTKLLDELKKK